MERIAAKQIDGVVDTTNDQTVQGEKTFTSPANFKGVPPAEFDGIRINGLHIYWLKNLANFEEEGNFRLGITAGSTAFSFQQFQSGIWQDV